MTVLMAIDSAVAKKLHGLAIGSFTIENVTIKPSGSEFERVERRVLADIRKRYQLSTLKEDPRIACYRDMLWRLDLDPTKLRPSSEALLRRILRKPGRRLPRINSAVDACNLASVKTFIPMGIYDLDKIAGDLTLRFAKKDEAFFGIGGVFKKLTGKELVLSDIERIVHLYPCRDCEETTVSLETENLLVIVCGAPEIEVSEIKKAAERARDYVRRFVGGKVGRINIVGTRK